MDTNKIIILSIVIVVLFAMIFLGYKMVFSGDKMTFVSGDKMTFDFTQNKGGMAVGYQPVGEKAKDA